MKEYIILIVGAALLSVFGDVMSPAGWKKYIKIITGLVVVSVIVTPLAKLRKVDLLDNLQINDISEIHDYSNKWVIEEFEQVICEDVKQRISEEYGKECEVKATIRLTEDDRIERVDKLEIYMNKPPVELKKKLSEMYGISDDEVILYG